MDSSRCQPSLTFSGTNGHKDDRCLSSRSDQTVGWAFPRAVRCARLTVAQVSMILVHFSLNFWESKPTGVVSREGEAPAEPPVGGQSMHPAGVAPAPPTGGSAGASPSHLLTLPRASRPPSAYPPVLRLYVRALPTGVPWPRSRGCRRTGPPSPIGMPRPPLAPPSSRRSPPPGLPRRPGRSRR